MKIPGPRVLLAKQRIITELAALKALAVSRRAASLKQQMLKLAQLRKLEGDVSDLRRQAVTKRRVAQLAD